MLPNPWVIVVALVALGGATGGGFHLGYTYASAEYEQVNRKSLEAAVLQRKMHEQEMARVAGSYVAMLDAERRKRKTVIKRVVEYVEARGDDPVCLDPVGVRLANEAITGRPDLSGGPGGQVSGGAGADDRGRGQ